MTLKNCDVYQLKDIIKNKKLVCFGMGKVLHDFVQDFLCMEFEKDIFAIADNKVEKETYILFNKIFIKVINPKQLIEIEDIVILISCADVAEILEQLNSYGLADTIDCYVVYFIRSLTNCKEEKDRKYPITFKISEQQKIPKRIHYCWFGNKPLPEKNRGWMESWKKYCPDYEIVRWDENNYDFAKNRYMHEAFKEKKWAFVSDYARLDIVFNYGGIYLDTDVELVKSFDELLYQDAFCGIEASKKINLGLGFGAKEGHPLFQEILNLYNNIHFVDKEGKQNLTTCVQIQDAFYKKKGFLNNGNFQIIQDMSVYPELVFSPKDLYTGELNITEYTFSIHHYDASWTDKKTKKRVNTIKELYRKLER